MGVIDPQRLLTDEPQQRVRVPLLEHLRGHITPAPVVPGTPDGTHPAPADRVDQFVPAREDLTHGCAPLLPWDLSRHARGPGRRTSGERAPRDQFWWDW